ncbi:transcriptional regulator, TraR/DksA family [Caldicellulosiruptor kronotskyensis 2002]|uniref:Transcriptional regulator, TraR/DksA family n=1 Tax=Caldicellulosiruptor kronotskyensis (strain DSM 18902 / VKM B-2412 / 2002) TaxID=632348 RepID=E4SBS5_CALK2|nr:TraR/DksA C4-type zinc finger protein [Caldicellulosiruptor kronotskyensis]ADQ46198.1 transcriptional regulator, TraR/DksA family [Caldicellulosiruptor kronotskyensis 2002]
MQPAEIEMLKKLLLEKKSEVEEYLKNTKKNQIANFSSLYSNEVSNYDNHPADIASDLFEAEKNMSLKADMKRKLELIEKALSKIEKGNFGYCMSCKKEIPIERLLAIPYTEFCIECQKDMENQENYQTDQRPIEEKVLGKPFNDKFPNQGEEEHDGTDMWNLIRIHSTSNTPQDEMVSDGKNYYKNVNDIDDSVEEIDKISKDNF